MSKLDNLLVYHWHAWEGYLISHLVADYCHIAADYDDKPEKLLRQLTPNIKAVLFQINLSRSADFPQCRSELVMALQARGIKVLNTLISDISKHHLHYLLDYAGLRSAKAGKLGNSDERLFIKSNLNWGGGPEQRLPNEIKHRLIENNTPRISRWDEYAILKRSEIPLAYWQDNSVVIEKYIENTDNSFYRMYCFGDSIVIVKAHSQSIIKKIGNHPRDTNYHLDRQTLLNASHALPEDLLITLSTFITKFPLDYFCLDVVHDHERHYIIDLNLTPYSGSDEGNSAEAEFLRTGFDKFISNIRQQEKQAK